VPFDFASLFPNKSFEFYGKALPSASKNYSSFEKLLDSKFSYDIISPLSIGAAFC